MTTMISETGTPWERSQFRYCGRWVWVSQVTGQWAILSEEGQPVVLTEDQAEEAFLVPEAEAK